MLLPQPLLLLPQLLLFPQKLPSPFPLPHRHSKRMIQITLLHPQPSLLLLLLLHPQEVAVKSLIKASKFLLWFII